MSRSFIYDGGAKRPQTRIPIEQVVRTFAEHRYEVDRFKELLDRQVPLEQRVPRGRFLPKSYDV